MNCFSRSSTAVEEPWDAPFQWKTDSASKSNIKIQKSNSCSQLTDLPYTRDPKEQIQKLPVNPIETNVSDKPKVRYAVKSPSKIVANKPKEEESELEAIMNQRNRLITNSTLANKDFRYIKPSIVDQKPQDRANPIAELKMLGKKETPGSEDEPPFNFQKMLRKTNFQRDSLKKAVEIFRHGGDDKNYTHCNGISNGDGYVRIELSPGVILEGIVAEL